MKRFSRAVTGAVRFVTLTVVLTTALPCAAWAQAPAAVIELAEKDRAARNATAALARYEAALASSPTSYDLLWRASRELVDLGEAATTAEKRTETYGKAEAYARRAVTANPNGADGHFMLAVALGRTALTLGSRDRIRYATDIYDQASAAVKLDARHAGALHVLAVWNAEVMRLSGMQRFAARNFMGGKVFERANWADARRYIDAAVAADPGRITHRLDKALIYNDSGDKATARTTCTEVLSMPTVEFNDSKYKTQCQQLVAKLP